MAFEDISLQCVSCSETFVFTVGEQTFFSERGLNAPPKRCKKCRDEAKKRKHRKPNLSFGEYRSPAFDSTAPRSLRRGPGGKRGPDKRRHDGDYRSPSFRDVQTDFAADYRSPAFQEDAGLNPAEEYRSPGFKEYETINPEEEYRSPAFQRDEDAPRSNERPMFSITCVACGEHAMVPFIPEEKEDPMCKDCYREHREMLRKEAEAEAAEAAKTAEESAAAEAASSAPSEPDSEPTEESSL